MPYGSCPPSRLAPFTHLMQMWVIPALLTGSAAAWAQPSTPHSAHQSARPASVNAPAPAAKSSSAANQSIANGERLSAWLLRRPTQPNDYFAGTLWQVPEEKPAQQALKEQVVLQLAGTGRYPALVDWLRQRDATGRVALSIADGMWLPAHPDQDPVLQRGQSISVPQRPTTVTVVMENGQFCQVPFLASALAPEYLRACMDSSDANARDTVWIAQPDGRQQRYGIGLWNAETQLSPAPGAWLWAPRHDSGISAELSDRLIRFLATQGPAPDGIGATDVPGISPANAPTATASSRIAATMAPALNAESRTATMRSRDLQRTASDWGEIGLMQTPTARMGETGDFRFHLSKAQPYTRGTVMFQPLDWLEGGFRYTDISDRAYDPTGQIASQSYKDKSIDAKVRLWRESRYIPQLAVGVRDFGGTGLFSGEYVVANKRTGDFDWSLGMGWGYLGSRGDISNPLGLLSSKAKTRPGSVRAGDANFKSMFRGRAAFFGGVQWQTPYEPLILKLEYEGNDYKSEPSGSGSLKQRTPFNVGAVYRFSRSMDFSLGYERGNKVVFGITLHTNLAQVGTPKAFDPPVPPVLQRYPSGTPDLDRTANDISQATNWRVNSMQQKGQTLHVVVEDNGTVYRSERTEKALAILHRDAPADVQYFSLDFASHGMALDRRTTNRTTWLAREAQAAPPAQRGTLGLPYSYLRGEGGAERVLQAQNQANATNLTRNAGKNADGNAAPDVTLTQANTQPPGVQTATAPAAPSAPLSWKATSGNLTGGLSPSLWQSFGGPDAFMLYQIGLYGSAEYRFTPSTWISGGANYRLIDNYDKFKFTGSSRMPRVRTRVREYVTDSRLTIDNLQLTHVEQFGLNQFVSVYGGLLESMYAGVGGEWLYRPVASRWAFGVDINRVKQRGYDQKFSMRDYSVTTGHATLYWNTGWNGVTAKISAGQYLAGDKGATLDISRTFSNGVTVGAWATKTNVSSAQFGEGSFDKGIYLTIPFDTMLPRSSATSGRFVWQPLLRDGGARLNRAVQLYDLTGTRDGNAFSYQPSSSGKRSLPPTGEDIFNRSLP